jgi:hypothetical protein
MPVLRAMQGRFQQIFSLELKPLPRRAGVAYLLQPFLLSRSTVRQAIGKVVGLPPGAFSQSRPLDREGADFLRADVGGEDRRAIRCDRHICPPIALISSSPNSFRLAIS